MSHMISRLSDWSSLSTPLAPLSSCQLDLVTELGEELRTRPPPAHLTSGPASQRDHGDHQPGDRVRTGGETELLPAFRQLEDGELSLGTAQQFLQWFHQVEESVVREQSAPYINYIKRLEHQLELVTRLSDRTEESLALLERLSSQYWSVSEKTVSLHDECQHLLEEQTRLAQLDKDLAQRLSVFLTAEKVAHKLTSPTLSVHSETFPSLLETLDSNISYLLAHPTYRDSPTYLTKYRACLSRAMNMLRSYTGRVLETATAAAKTQDLNTEESQSQTAFTLFYGKFRAAAPKVRPLLEEIEKRVDNPDLPEYSSLLSDVQTNYFGLRLSLLGASVKGAVGQLVTVHTRDHTGLLRAGCAFLLHVCDDEHQLYHQFFSRDTEDDLLADYLETLCLILYDNLRPLIIHITHLETLSELTSILRNEVVGQHCVQHPKLTSFKRVTTQMLADVQERLVYRTSVYIRSDILGYNPSPGDLAYPDKLEMMERIAETIKEEERRSGPGHSRQNSSSSVVSLTSLEVGSITGKTYSGTSPADLHGMWYPPVRRTLLTLSKLYRCLELPIFTGLSQEVLTACCQSVASAASLISNNPAKTKADGQLFEIKHLLILREQIAPFQGDFKVKETSLKFSHIKTAAVSLLNHRSDILSLSSNNALLEFILHSTPAIQEHLLDSKKDVDRRLKAVCEQFIADCSVGMLRSVMEINSKVATFQAMRADKQAKLSSQPWADTNILTTAVTETVKLIKQNVPAIQRKMQLYLANNETEFILFRPVRSNILTCFVSLVTTLRAEYSMDQQTIIGCPTQEQLAAILASVMLTQTARPRPTISSRQVSESPELNIDNESNGEKSEESQLV